MDCVEYSQNWIVSSLAYMCGSMSWAVCFIVMYNDTVSGIELAVPVTDFCLGIWTSPFLLYWTERKRRRRVFSQWCQEQVIIQVIINSRRSCNAGKSC